MYLLYLGYAFHICKIIYLDSIEGTTIARLRRLCRKIRFAKSGRVDFNHESWI